MEIYATCDIVQIFFVHGFDWSTNSILMKIDIHVRFMKMHVL